MKTTTTIGLALVSLILLSPQARAEIVDSVGARVGGYGFRQAPVPSADHTGWNDCRMNGVGVFAERRMSRHLFVEAGVDAYFADSFPTGSHQHGEMSDEVPMDRISGLMTIAGGLRWAPASRFSPFVVLGTGLEVTRVSMPTHDMEATRALPLAFLGVGGDVRIGARLRLGAALRMHVMAEFDHSATATEMDASPELAAQGLFYARFDL